ncbi:uncharacterized protein LOC144619527 [Crassostrea virginica]
MPRSVRRDKVMFLTAIYDHGSRLDIPPRMKYSNIIDSDSLPNNRTKETKRSEPDPTVHNIPSSHWPQKDTPILPIDSSANEVWNSCMQGSRRKNYRRAGNSSNSALNDTKSEDSDRNANFVSDNYEVRKILHKLERLSPDQREIVLRDIRPEEYTTEDYLLIRSTCEERAREYLQTLRNVFMEKGLGEPPETEDPVVLSREINRRMRLAMLGY